MKAYKLVNSIEVQRKAFRLGYEYSNAKDDEACQLNTFLYLRIDMTMFTGVKFDDYSDAIEFEEITQKDFLALPEPILVGDWVRFKTEDHQIIFKVTEVKRGLLEASWKLSFGKDHCTKLNPEQIKTLELENA